MGKKKSFEEVKKKINSSGEASIGKARRHAGFSPPTISTGIFMMDVAMGGGMPRGKIMRIFGDESTGKTTTLYKFYASAQRTCNNCNSKLVTNEKTKFQIFDKIKDDYRFLTKESSENMEEFSDIEFPYYDDESEIQNQIVKIRKVIMNELDKDIKRYDIVPYRSIEIEDCTLCDNPEPLKCLHLDVEVDWDNEWADACGIDTDKIEVMRIETTEEGIDNVNKALRTGDIDFFGLDSWAALTPEVEVENEAGDKTMGNQAKLANKALRKWVSALGKTGIDDENKPIIALLNQYRMKIGQHFGDPRTTPGGKGQNFASSIDIEMLKPDDEHESGDMDTEDKIIYAKEFKFNIKKNKMITEGRRGTYKLYTRYYDGHETGEVDDVGNVLDLARDYEILDKEKSKYVYKDEDMKADTLTELKENIKDDYEIYQKVREQVVELLK